MGTAWNKEKLHLQQKYVWCYFSDDKEIYYDVIDFSYNYQSPPDEIFYYISSGGDC